MIEDAKPKLHRLFVASPVPIDAATQLHGWAASALAEPGVRLVEPENMHVTFFFFASATNEKKDRVAELVSKFQWRKVLARASRTILYRHGAITVELESGSSQDDVVKNRDGETWLELVKELDQTEMQRMWRRNSGGWGEPMNLTLARTKVRDFDREYPTPPDVELTLDRICLYESAASTQGVTHELIVERLQSSG